MVQKDELLAILKRLSAIYPNQPISPELIEDWIIAFDDMNFTQMSFGLTRCLKEHSTGFFPDPATFRKYCQRNGKMEEVKQIEKAINPVPMPPAFRELLSQYTNKISVN